MQDQFTGSIEVKNNLISSKGRIGLLFLERYYNTPQYIFGNENVMTELIYKDKDGAVGSTFGYDYTIAGGLINQFILDQGIRVDLFELNYECQ